MQYQPKEIRTIFRNTVRHCYFKITPEFTQKLNVNFINKNYIDQKMKVKRIGMPNPCLKRKQSKS